MIRHILAFISIPFLALAVGGCVTNPITGRSQAMMVSDAAAAQQSSQAYSQLLSQAQQKRTLDEDPAATQRVRAIRGRIKRWTRVAKRRGAWGLTISRRC